MKKVKVLHLLSSGRFSGAENVVCQIIDMMKNEQNIEMIYCSKDGEIRDALKERQISYYPISKLSVSEVKKAINELKPDIIHVHDMRASFIAALACGKIRLISHIHNNAFDSRGISVKSILYLYAALKAKHIFWVSESSYKGYAFHSLFSKKSSILYNIVNKASLYERMNGDKGSYDYDVAYVGRLSYPKNPEKLIEALKLVVEKMPEVKVAIAGTGELEENVKQLICDKGLGKNIDMVGFLSNPLKLLHDAKVMIMTSRWEGTPMCALESMALGVPIVSTPTDGLCELVDSGKTGYLSENNQELADGIIKILTDNEIYKTFSQNTKNKFDKICNLEMYKNAVLNMYGIGERRN